VDMQQQNAVEEDQQYCNFGSEHSFLHLTPQKNVYATVFKWPGNTLFIFFTHYLNCNLVAHIPSKRPVISKDRKGLSVLWMACSSGPIQ
jgi:hypothetical protein